MNYVSFWLVGFVICMGLMMIVLLNVAKLTPFVNAVPPFFG